MSLRTKIVLILAGVTVLWAAGDYFLLDRMVSGQFRKLGEEEAVSGMSLVESCFQAEVQHMREKARVLASVTEVERFVTGEDGLVAPTCIREQALAAADVHLIYLCGADGTVKWGRIEDPETREPISMKRSFPGGALAMTHPLLARDEESCELPYMTTERGIMLVSVQALGSPETDEASPTGWIVLGRFVDAGLRSEIEEQSTHPIDMWDLRDPAMGELDAKLLERVTSAVGELVIVSDDDGNLLAHRTLSGIEGRPDLLIRTTIEHGIIARGKKATSFLALSTIGTSILIFLVLLRVLQKTVVNPLMRFTNFAMQVAETDDTTARLSMDREDEIGILSKEFDRMLEELAKSRELLVQTARQAGMSEIATGVLHNVGNVLTSVNVSASLLKQKVGQMTTADLDRLVQILDEHEADLGAFVTTDERGKHTLPFLREMRDSLEQQRETIDQEVCSLYEGIEHIADLVRAQQSYAGTRGVFESTSLPEQVDAAIRICHQAYGDEGGVEVVREYEPEMPAVRVDKHKLLEILVNLIRNARQALDDSDQPSKLVVLRARRTDRGTALVEVEDNGTGIAPLNLEKIFNHGFTTKVDGHGFGLHVSANAAKEMDSSLHAESAGPGQGAKFTLEIPLAAEKQRQAA